MRTRPRKRLQNAGDDTGSALVLALMIVLLVGALLAAVLDFTSTGLTVAPKVRNDRNEANYVQGAVEGAINRVRASSLLGTPGSPGCPEFTPDAPDGADVPGASGRAYRVTCSAQAVIDPSAEAVPAFAIHALGSGITQTSVAGGGDELVVDGGVYSKGSVEVPSPPVQNVMTVYGAVTAEGGCSGQIYTTDLLGARCTAADALDIGDDPNYGTTLDSAALASMLATGDPSTGSDPLPTCSAGVVSFAAGHYSTAPPVLATKAGCSGAGMNTWHFASGSYYFDYEGIWNIGLKKVVFGDSADLSKPLGKACSRTSGGAHLVFGGSSQMASTSSAGDWGVEVCGPSDTSYYSGPTPAQRIAVYGLTTANDVSTPAATPAADTSPGTVAASGSGSWLLSPEDGRVIGGAVATNATIERNKTSELQFSAFQPGPKGSAVTKVELVVKHRVVNATADLKVTAAGLAGQPQSFSLSDCTTCVLDVTDVVDDAPTDVLWRYLSTIDVRYEAKGSPDNVVGLVRTAAVDGVALRVTHVPAALRAQTCLPTSCTFVESGNNPNFHVHGTVYTPEAHWRVRVHGSGETIFDRGVVLSSLAIVAGSSSKQTSAPFQLPHGPSVARRVLFRGYVDDVEQVRACVTYIDVAPLPGSSDTTAFPGYRLSVDSWVAYRTPPTTAATCP